MIYFLITALSLSNEMAAPKPHKKDKDLMNMWKAQKTNVFYKNPGTESCRYRVNTLHYDPRSNHSPLLIN